MYTKLIVAILLCLLVLGIFLVFFKREVNEEKDIVFLSHQKTKVFLELDRDSYVRNMSTADLYARKSNTPLEYINKISKCTMTFSEDEKNKIRRCVFKADEFLKKYVYRNILICKDISKIKWTFALTYKNDSFEYEEGLPHTRDDVIFLSKYTINDAIASSQDDRILTNTLVHEKIHIFQRYNEKIMHDVVKGLGYLVATNISPEALKLKRCNPDIDNKVYYNPENNKEMLFTYTSATPKGINDISSSNFSIEHPYETIAYEIANEFSRRSMSEITKYL